MSALALPTRPAPIMMPMPITNEPPVTTPARSWNGQTVVTLQDHLLALRQRLPTFHRAPFIVNGMENPQYDVIVGDASDYPVTTVSKAYGLVQHDVVFDQAMAGLATLGFDLHGLEAELALTEHGERFKLSITIPGYDFDPGDGCPLVLRMTVLNSVDKTTAVAIELEWLRLVCGNGMMAGIGACGFRKAHFRGIDEEDIATYLADMLQQVPQDRRLMDAWLNRPLALPHTRAWVDHELTAIWGAPTAARVWHILQHGQDARPQKVFGEDTVPAHERPVIPLETVPGAFAPVANAYHVAQALSWVAKENRNMGTRLRRIKEIPALMLPLLSN